MAEETTLSEEVGLFDARRLFSGTEFWTFFFVGLALLITVFATMMWAESGKLANSWSFGRILTALVAILYGLGLGWMMYPRRFSRSYFSSNS